MNRRLLVMTSIVLTVLAFGCGKKLGTGADRTISITPRPITFGFVPQGTTRKVTVTVKNVGTADGLKLYSIAMKSGSSKDFSVTQPPKMVLNAGESTTFDVVYKPSDCKTDNGFLVVDSNAAQGPIEVKVSAAKPDIRIMTIPELDFGKVSLNQPKSIETVLVNAGSINFVAKSLRLSANTSEYFKILQIGEKGSQKALLPMTMDPNANADPNHALIPLVVQFAPKEAGTFTGEIDLTVDACNPDTGETTETTLSVPIQGVGIGPKLVAFPGMLDFGHITIPNSKPPLVLTVVNQGTENAVIPPKGVYLVKPIGPGPNPKPYDPGVKIDDPLTKDLTLAPDESHKFHISWKPTKPPLSPSGDLGSLVINDKNNAGPSVPIRGVVDAPILTPVPPQVDFGFVGQKITIQKTLTLKNTGHADLTIHSIQIQGDPNGEFAIVPDNNFPPTTGGGDATIQGNKQQPIKLKFTNNGAASGDATATLVISSNSATGDPTNVQLIAHRAGSPQCKPVLSPPVLNYGVVAEQMSKTLTMHLKNAGTGPCTFKGAAVWDCSASIFGGRVCPEPFSGGSGSNYYKIKVMPPSVFDGLQPGGQIDIPIQFMPPSTGGSIFGQFNEFDGLFAVKIYNRFTQPPSENIYPGGGQNKKWSANLLGKSGIANVTVMPSTVDFGLVTIGCYSKTYKVCVYNTGTAAVQITDVKLDGCSSEFHLKKVPALPFSVAAGTPLCFETNYSPVDEGEDACNISIVSDNGMTLNVGLTGAGTYDTHQVDKFTQVSGQTVDILFVIDDSGSMSDKQQRLKDNFDKFIQHADVWHNDYHLGVISICVDNAKVRGKLNLGNKNKMPRFITPKTPNGRSLFKKYVMLGDGNSCSDKRESGLEAAQAALSSPLISDTGKACSTDADCTGDSKICPNANDCPYSCIDGTCAGWNKGFLRKDAQLEILVLSDEEDQSHGSVSFYTNFFKSIKGFYNTNMFHWNSIVGMDASTGDCSNGCTAADGAQAEHGCRYTQVSQSTNGKVGSVCDTDYGPVMDAIGAQAFGLKLQFFLTRLADPPTIKVTVDGKNCGPGYLKLGEPSTPGWTWRYDEPSNSVIFEENGSCTPKPGQKITVEYDTLCLTQ